MKKIRIAVLKCLSCGLGFKVRSKWDPGSVQVRRVADRCLKCRAVNQVILSPSKVSVAWCQPELVLLGPAVPRNGGSSPCDGEARCEAYYDSSRSSEREVY